MKKLFMTILATTIMMSGFSTVAFAHGGMHTFEDGTETDLLFFSLDTIKLPAYSAEEYFMCNTEALWHEAKYTVISSDPSVVKVSRIYCSGEETQYPYTMYDGVVFSTGKAGKATVSITREYNGTKKVVDKMNVEVYAVASSMSNSTAAIGENIFAEQIKEIWGTSRFSQADTASMSVAYDPYKVTGLGSWVVGVIDFPNSTSKYLAETANGASVKVVKSDINNLRNDYATGMHGLDVIFTANKTGTYPIKVTEVKADGTKVVLRDDTIEVREPEVVKKITLWKKFDANGNSVGHIRVLLTYADGTTKDLESQAFIISNFVLYDDQNRYTGSIDTNGRSDFDNFPIGTYTAYHRYTDKNTGKVVTLGTSEFEVRDAKELPADFEEVNYLHNQTLDTTIVTK